MRPIVKDVGITSLAKCESVLSTYYIEIEQRKNLLNRIKDKLGTIQSLKAAQFEISFEKDPKVSTQKTGNILKTHIRETHLNAWVKNFNPYYSNNGFYRIWDFPPVNLTESMTKELLTISENISRRIERDSQTFRMP